MRDMKYLTYVLLCLSLTQVVLAEEVDAPQPFPPYTLVDQHGESCSLQPETRTVIMCFEMELSKRIHAWLAQKHAEYLADHHAEYVADVSPMPGMVLKLFAGPKMRKFKFPILLATSEKFSADYAHQAETISVFRLTADQTQATVTYVKTVKEIESMINDADSGAETPPDQENSDPGT